MWKYRGILKRGRINVKYVQKKKKKKGKRLKKKKERGELTVKIIWHEHLTARFSACQWIYPLWGHATDEGQGNFAPTISTSNRQLPFSSSLPFFTFLVFTISIFIIILLIFITTFEFRIVFTIYFSIMSDEKLI